MVKYCSAYGCTNVWVPNGTVIFHKFPVKNPERLELWIKALRRKDFKPNNHTVICSDHFKEEDYLESSQNKNLLKRDAVPSIFNFSQDVSKGDMKRKQLTSPQQDYVAESESLPIKRRKVKILEDCIEYEILPTNQEFIQVTCSNTTTVATQTTHFKTENETDLQRQLKNLQRQLKRRNIQLRSMKDFTIHVRKIKNCGGDVEEVLKNNFQGFQVDLFKNKMRVAREGVTRRIYTEEMKKFSLTLHFYSSPVYASVSDKLNLPDCRTLRQWICSTNCEVGFLTEIFRYLSHAAANNAYLEDVALVVDSMPIRSTITYDKKLNKHCGYVNMGGIANINNEELATEALVFQIVSFTRQFKCPIAYFLVNKIPPAVQQQLIKSAIEKLDEIGIKVKSITCGGSTPNIKTLTLLGCKLAGDDIRPYFRNPCNNDKIFCILDPCRILKLATNAFAEVSLSSSKGRISFSYVKKLRALQEKECLNFADLPVCHANFKEDSMKARLVARIISSNVATALDFLCKSGHPDFIGSEATVEFLQIFDKGFDIMNSRSIFAKGRKKPLYLDNKRDWSAVFEKTKDYILDLKADGVNVFQHRRKMFALGFLMNLISFERLALNFLSCRENPFKYFLTSKCSQDHLQLFFSSIRSRGGWKDDPNALQFKWALRKLLFNKGIKSGVNPNCFGTDFNLTPVFESRLFENDRESKETIDNDEDLCKFISAVNRTLLTSFQDNILYYISGFILKKLLKNNYCTHCINILLPEIQDDHDYSLNSNYYTAFTKFNNQIVLDIIKCTEKAFKAEINMHHMSIENLKQRIIVLVLQRFIDNNNLKTLFVPFHPVIDIHKDLHEVQVIKFICATYAHIRISTCPKKSTLQLSGDKTNIRHEFHNATLFYQV